MKIVQSALSFFLHNVYCEVTVVTYKRPLPQQSVGGGCSDKIRLLARSKQDILGAFYNRSLPLPQKICTSHPQNQGGNQLIQVQLEKHSA